MSKAEESMTLDYAYILVRFERIGQSLHMYYHNMSLGPTNGFCLTLQEAQNEQLIQKLAGQEWEIYKLEPDLMKLLKENENV